MKARLRQASFLAVVAATSLLAAGCVHSLGPQQVPQARPDYNRAVARSWDEQLLLNLADHRGAWFYLEDSDLQSKSTFLLLSQLFSLQAGSAGGRSPLLTVSAGGS